MKKRSSYALLKRFAIFILLPLIAVLSFGIGHLKNSLPKDGDSFYVEGLTGPVAVYRDEHGALSIEAATDSDAFFAVGFSHAQDRLWQLELLRRTSRGELSELLGKRGVALDIRLRTLQLYQKAKNSVQHLSEPAANSLVAYAKGVNAFLVADNVLPLELKVLGIQPEPWQPADSIAILKLLALQLSENSSSSLHKAAHRQFFSRTSQNDKALCDIAESTENCLSQIISAISNPISGSAFVISRKALSGSHSILVSDFQLDAEFPIGWYATHLKTNRLNNTGMTLIGLPVPLFGHNSNFAWAGVNRIDNSQQLIAELTSVEDYNLYKTGEDWRPFDVFDESITIKPDLPFGYSKKYEPVKVQRRETVNGPVINDNSNLFDLPLTLKWTGLSSVDTSYEAFYKLNYATDWETFKEALRLLIAPGFNMVFVDQKGNIGRLSAGAEPLIENQSASLLLPGWDNSAVWEKFVPPSEWPSQYNPGTDVLAVTNQPILNYASDGSAPSYEGNRHKRISWLLEQRLLNGQGDVSIDDALSIQQDTFSASAKELVDLLLNLEVPQNASYPLEELRQWNGEMSAESSVAAIVSFWSILLKQNLFADELTLTQDKLREEPALLELIGSIPLGTVVRLLSHSPESQVCDDGKTAGHETCEAILVSSFEQALDRITLILGGDIKSWNLKSLSYIPFRHVAFSDINVLNAIFDRKMFVEGGEDSIKQAPSAMLTSRGVEQKVITNFVQAMEVYDSHFSYNYVLVPGQSGNALSEHFDDMLSFAQAGIVKPLEGGSDQFASRNLLRPGVADTTE